MFEVCVNQINVHDMDKALEFYCEKMGFAVASKDFYPNLVPLKHRGIHLVLCKVENPVSLEYGKSSQSLINFRSQDLARDMTRLREKGVDFLHEAPRECPVGIYAAFRDLSGNVHELVEFRD